jgi:hypothetical protein
MKALPFLLHFYFYHYRYSHYHSLNFFSLHLRSLISIFLGWVSFLAYPNIFGIKCIVVVVVVCFICWLQFFFVYFMFYAWDYVSLQYELKSVFHLTHNRQFIKN